ncbi:hypothetical protein CVT26_005067 [Gymnopilus dilepis]|uniref:Uncharacterized protein n=1 Tax=Gymnopilus dilepis TaxID=231916 RepID=A0A409Y097_9AGAR|nr:hypothetical protein CVT26_005067 [Gymnopilus dilepis]
MFIPTTSSPPRLSLASGYDIIYSPVPQLPPERARLANFLDEVIFFAPFVGWILRITVLALIAACRRIRARRESVVNESAPEEGDYRRNDSVECEGRTSTEEDFVPGSVRLRKNLN